MFFSILISYSRFSFFLLPDYFIYSVCMKTITFAYFCVNFTKSPNTLEVSVKKEKLLVTYIYIYGYALNNFVLGVPTL